MRDTTRRRRAERRDAERRRAERGAALVEFAIGALVFLLAVFAVLEFGRLLWTHNALADAARRASRYAITQSAGTASSAAGITGKNVGPSITAIRNVAVYGKPQGGTSPLVNGLKPENVEVVYSNFALGDGTVSVRIVNYDFNFVLPVLGATLAMPTYHTTLTAESIGYKPKDI